MDNEEYLVIPEFLVPLVNASSVPEAVWDLCDFYEEVRREVNYNLPAMEFANAQVEDFGVAFERFFFYSF